MKKKVFYSLLLHIVIILTSCLEKNNQIFKLSFNASDNGKDYHDFFDFIEKYSFSSILSKSIKLNGINKLFETKDGYFIVYDQSSNNLVLVNETGELKKIIGKEGKGPGEFSLLSDFIYDDKNNEIYALDFFNSSVLYYKQYNFVKSFNLSFEHRNPTLILKSPNNSFIIAAEKNLTSGSNNENYNFLDFKDVNYLNIYNNKFKLNYSFLTPDKRLHETKGLLSRPTLTSFSPSCILGDKIITIKQEGFYEIVISDLNGKFIKQYTITQESFKELSNNSLNEIIKLAKKDESDLEKVGGIIADYTAPLSIFVIKNIIIVYFMEPYDNYFPMYSTKDEKNTYYIDLFKYDQDALTFLYGGIKLDKKIIGTNQDGYIYFVNDEYFEDITEIKIEKYKLKLWRWIKQIWILELYQLLYL